MQGRLLGVSEAISAAWATFQKYPGVLVGVYLVYTIVGGVLGIIPLVGPILTAFIVPPLAGGATIVGLKAVRGQSPEFNDLSSGFQKYWL